MMEFMAYTDRFTVSLGGRTVFAFCNEQHTVSVGVGQGTYRMVHGYFKVREKIVSQRPLTSWKIIAQKPEEVVVDFNGVLTVSFTEIDGRLHMGFTCTDTRINRVWVDIPATPGEHIYGCGEQYSRLDLKGLKVPLFTEEQGVGRGRDLITFLAELTHGAGGTWSTTYYPQPTFVSSANYACHVETTAYAVMDFSKPDRHTLHCWAIPEKIVLDVQDSAVATVSRMSDFLGRQPEMPAWVYNGVWLGLQGGSAIVSAKLQTALDAGVKVGALWCQDWVGKRITDFGKQLMWDWIPDTGTYPDLRTFIEHLRGQGVMFLGYVNPLLAIEGSLYAEASARGYIVKQADGREYPITISSFPAVMVDLSNPEAFQWLKDIIRRNMLELGMAGWMADYGESLPTDAALASGASAEGFHNRYPVEWARLNHEVLAEAGKIGEILFFMRAGFTGTSRYASCIWAGDQLPNWSFDDGLATVIPAGLSLGFCGIGLYHSDIGGFTTVGWIKRSKELFMRWAEHAAFTPVMRTHEGLRPDDNWQFDGDAETLAHFARMSRIYCHLAPYTRHIIREYVTAGLPPMRHPYIHYEQDETLHRLQYQYLYGRDLMIAPVIKPRRATWKVYLPDDAWIELWTGNRYGAGWHTVPAPLGQPPVFYRNASDFAGLFAQIRETSRGR